MWCSTVFCIVTPCRSERVWRFGGTYHHLQCRSVSKKRAEASGMLSFLTFWPWIWRWNFSSETSGPLRIIHGVTSDKKYTLQGHRRGNISSSNDNEDSWKLDTVAYCGAPKFVLLTRYCGGDQIEEDNGDGTCSAHEKWKKSIQNFSREIYSRNVAGSVPDEFMGFFNWPNLSSRTMALGSTQPLIEMSTRNLPGGKGRPAGAYGWQPHRHLWGDFVENMGASTSHKPMGLHGLLQE
jgi:hypothetical protein